MPKITKNIKIRRWENLEQEILKHNNKPANIESYIAETHLKTELLKNVKLQYNENNTIYDNLLPLAVWENRPIIVEWLLTKKLVNPLIEDAQKANGIYIAIEQGNLEIAEMFLNVGILKKFLENQPTIVSRVLSFIWSRPAYDNKNHPDNLLKLATEKGEERIMKKMLNDYPGFSQILLSECFLLAAKKGWHKITKLLIETNYVDVNIERKVEQLLKAEFKINNMPQTPILWAIKNNDPIIAEQLIIAGSRTKWLFNNGNVMHFAAELGYSEVLEVFLKYKTNDINEAFGIWGTRIGEHWTPLLLAINKNHVKVVQLLIEYGVDYNHKYPFYNGKTAYEIALSNRKSPEICDMLKNAELTRYASKKAKASKIMVQQKEKSEINLIQKIIDPKISAKLNNAAAIPNFEINTQTKQYTKCKSKSAKAKKQKIIQKNIVEIKKLPSASPVNHKHESKLNRFKNSDQSCQPVVIAEAVRQYEKAETIAQQHEIYLEAKKAQKSAEVKPTQQLEFVHEFNNYQTMINQARIDLISEIDDTYWVVLRTQRKDHELGRPGIILAVRGTKVYMLLASTQAQAKNKPHLELVIEKSGRVSYFSEIAIVSEYQIRGPWPIDEKLKQEHKMQISQIPTHKLIKKLFPERFLNYNTNDPDTKKQNPNKSQNSNLDLQTVDEELIKQNCDNFDKNSQIGINISESLSIDNKKSIDALTPNS